MQTFAIADEHGEPRAFEVENIYLTRKSLRSLVSSIPGVSSVHRPTGRGQEGEIRLSFVYKETPFEVWEPFGDNSRYWIGPKENEPNASAAHLRDVEQAFQNYRPPLLLKVLGDLVSLRFDRLFSRA